jgi:hypothetical protein
MTNMTGGRQTFLVMQYEHSVLFYILLYLNRKNHVLAQFILFLHVCIYKTNLSAFPNIPVISLHPLVLLSDLLLGNKFIDEHPTDPYTNITFGN